MQDARRRLALEGPGTLYIQDMLPIKSDSLLRRHNSVSLDDPNKLSDCDQRPAFWKRFAFAKVMSMDPPAGMIADELEDLTKEPLLAYLVILSGYIDANWEAAASNRNRVYESIFTKIWDRERSKPTRANLNDLGKSCFFALLQSLGLASWRGNSRTGDESTFSKIRDMYLRNSYKVAASTCGILSLENVAVLFYTRRDEEGRRGFEFLHKSFGEYLAGTALVDLFFRLLKDLMNDDSSLDTTIFIQKWVGIVGTAQITEEILQVSQNEIRLRSRADSSDLRDVVKSASLVADALLRGEVCSRKRIERAVVDKL